MGYVLGDSTIVTTGLGAGAVATVLPQTGSSSLSIMALIAAVTAGVMVASRVITRVAARRQA